MNKKLIIIGIFTWFLIAVTGVAVFGMLASRGGFGQSLISFSIYQNKSDFKDFKEVENQVITEDIQSININWAKGSVILRKSDDDTVKLVHKADENGYNQKKMAAKVEGSTLLITDIYNQTIKLLPATSLELYLPEKQYNELKIENIAADFSTDFIRFRTLDVETVSGRISFEGDFDKVEIESVSGKIKSDNISAASLMLDVVSGSIDIKGNTNKLYINAVSGSVDVTSSTMINSLDSDTVSGSVTVKIPENDGFSVYVDKDFSRFSCDFPTTSNGNGQIYKNGEAKFNINTLSGNVKIAKIS